MPIDSFNEYQQRASRTMAGGKNRAYEFKSLRQSVWALGLVGEAIEVMDYFRKGYEPASVLVKELGDVCWYVAAMCEEHKLPMSQVAGFDSVQAFCNRSEAACPSRSNADLLVIQAGVVSEHMKKVLGHGHKLDRDKLEKNLLAVLYQIDAICRCFRIELVDVLGRNIEKLEARYKDGFSTEASKARVDTKA